MSRCEQANVLTDLKRAFTTGVPSRETQNPFAAPWWEWFLFALGMLVVGFLAAAAGSRIDYARSKPGHVAGDAWAMAFGLPFWFAAFIMFLIGVTRFIIKWAWAG